MHNDLPGFEKPKRKAKAKSQSEKAKCKELKAKQDLKRLQKTKDKIITKEKRKNDKDMVSEWI